jgi:hypothetical protein
MKRLIIVSILVFLSIFSFGQKEKFSSQKDAFIQDLGKFIRDSKSEPAKQELEYFEAFWNAGSLSGPHQKSFVKLANKLAKKRYRPYPHFSSLMKATRLAIDSQKVAPDVMDTLMITFDKVVDNYKRPQYEFFFRTIVPFLERGTLNNGSKNDIVALGKFKIVWREKPEPIIEDIPEETPEQEMISAEDAWAEDEENTAEEDEYGDWDSWDDDSSEDEWTTDDAYGDDEFGDASKQSEEEVVEETVIVGYLAPDLPEIKGPVIEFESVDFEFATRYDSVALKETKATFLIAERKVIGEGGTFDWTSTGLDEEVKGTFKQYVFPTNKILIEAEGFTLNYDSKIEKPVEGIFMFASTKHSKPEKAEYPRFMSYNADVTLKDLGENVKYTGGFSMNGRRVYSSCVSLAKSKIEVFKNGHKMFVTNAVYFELGDSVITSNPSSVTVFFGGGQAFEDDTTSVIPQDDVVLTDSSSLSNDLTAVDSITTENTTSTNYRKIATGPGGAPTDSIYHPSVRLKYNIVTEKLSVYKNKSKYKHMPFVDTYHCVDIDVDAIYWTLSDTSMFFTVLNGRKEVTADFKSKDYFSEEDYVRLKGLYRFHPLQLLVGYSTNNDTKVVYIPALMKYSKQSKGALDHAMMDMMREGFVDYEPFSGRIKIKDKAFFYVASRKFDVDYDVITIQSVNPPKYNARLSLVDNGMTIEGVDSVYFSDSLDVNFHPKDRRLTMYKNRKILFNGQVNTSIYNFNGRELTFDYDLFNIDMVHIDSIKFTINTTDSITGRSKGSRQIDNKLSYSSGTLFIDSIANKSSKNTYPQYPYFDANRGAYVFFNQPDILGGVYDTVVYFKIPPFGSDSMSSSKEKTVGFDGEFVSASIFPPFEEKLVVMEDFSFGFQHTVPVEGYQTYGGDGVFFGTIRLDKQGLRGNGFIQYLNTIIESEDFIFYTDSMVAVGTNCITLAGTNENMDQSITFPQLGIENYEIKWYPQQDSMMVRNLMASFSFYDSTATLTGGVNISHKGLTGYGIFDRRGSRTVSPKFRFEQTSFVARDAEFEILSDVEGKPAVKSDFVKVLFRLDSGYASFGPEKEGFAANEFPYLQYKTSIDQGIWDFEEHTVTMTMPEGGDISQSYFYSTHPEQDSLVFNAEKAVYLMDSLSLFVTGVPEIVVADGRIIPDMGELFIKENAVLDTLRNARIVMDTINEFHRLYDGTINIISRSKFTGNAKYSYVNLLGDSLYINFNSFDLVETQISKKKTETHTETHTVSHGIIAEGDTFLMAPKMYYRGEATMHANKRMLSLHGAVKLDMQGEVPSPNWLNYDKEDEVDQIIIMTEGQKTMNGRLPVTGIHYSPVLGDYYVTFFGQKGGKKDFTIFKSNGVFMYDQEKGEYLVGDSMKISGSHYEGELFAYNEKEELVRIQGLIDIFGHPEVGEDEDGDKVENIEHPVEVVISAEGDKHLLDSTFFITGLTFLTFDYDSKALDVMGADLEQMAALYGIEQAYHFNDTLAYEIADVAGEKAAQDFRENPTLPLPKVVKEFAKGLVLTDVHLVWDKDHKAWYSKGRFGVGSVGKHQVNSMVTGYLEIRKGKGFSYAVNLYIELNDRVWYYLTFEQNKLLTVSSNTEYNAIVEKKNTRAKNEVMGNYFFDIAPSSSKERFFKRFITTHLDGEGLDDLDIEIVDPNEDEEGELEEDEETIGEEDPEEVEEEMDDENVDEDTVEEDEELTEEEEDEFFEEMQDEAPEEIEEEVEEEIQDEVTDEEVDENHPQEGEYYEAEEEVKPKKEKKKKKDKKKKEGSVNEG